ncbi:MAG: hypothetical protein ACXWUR_03405 [Allosphingosinicella sp.]
MGLYESSQIMRGTLKWTERGLFFLALVAAVGAAQQFPIGDTESALFGVGLFGLWLVMGVIARSQRRIAELKLDYPGWRAFPNRD